MKNNITYLIVFLIATLSATAQIDRSKIPASGPIPSINLGEPKTFQMGNGLTVLIVEDAKLPRVSISLSLDNPPNSNGKKAGISRIVSSLMGKGTKNIDKNTFNEEVDFLGAFLEVGTYGGFTQSLSKYKERIFELFAEAALQPIFTQEELDLELKKAKEGIKSQENNASAILQRVRAALAYGKNHSAGEFSTEETLNNITLADVEKYYNEHFVPANAYMVISGDIKVKDAKKLVEKHFTSWTRGKAPSFGLPDVKDAQYRQINFVDLPNAVQTEMAVTNITDLKMADEDYHAALVANYILGGSFNSYINMNLREEHGYTYSARTILPVNKNHNTAFRATAKVRNMVTDSAVVETLKEIKRIRTEEVDDKTLKNAKSKFLGDFILASENNRTMASRSIDIKTQNLPEDFYKTFIAKINAVSKEDVKRVANKYFNIDKARIVLVGKGSEVLENLEKITFEGKKIPILHYDKFTNRVDKPNYEVEMPKDMTVEKVFETYFTAIGGKDKLNTVNSIFQTAAASFNGANLNLVNKVTSKNQSLTEISFSGMVAQKIVFNKTKGYTIVQGQRKDYDETQIEEAKKITYPFPELMLKSAVLEKIEALASGKAYVVKIDDKKTFYFDTETGLKVKESVTQEMGGKQMTTSTVYSDYKEVNGIKFPFTITQSLGPQQIDFKISELKINEGVTDEDFK